MFTHMPNHRQVELFLIRQSIVMSAGIPQDDIYVAKWRKCGGRNALDLST